MAEFKDFAVTGEYVSGLPETERWFELTEEPIYEKKEGWKDEKLLFRVRLSNGTAGIYYPNITSQRRVANLNKTTDMSQWKGKKYYWGFIEKKQAFGGIKEFIYITDFYPNTVKVI